MVVSLISTQVINYFYFTALVTQNEAPFNQNVMSTIFWRKMRMEYLDTRLQ